MHYVPSKVTASILGLIPIKGFVEGTFINISKETRPFETRRSLDGEVGRIHRKDDRYIVEITLAQSSESNNVLTSLFNIDSSTGMGMFPLFIKDGSGTTTFIAADAHVVSLPEAGFSDGIESRIWNIECSNAVYNLGGNGDMKDLENFLSTTSSVLPLLSKFGVL